MSVKTLKGFDMCLRVKRSSQVRALAIDVIVLFQDLSIRILRT